MAAAKEDSSEDEDYSVDEKEFWFSGSISAKVVFDFVGAMIGGIVAPGAPRLAEFVSCFPEGFWKGKRVLELGAGTGLVSIVLAKLGASVTATDQPEVLENLKSCIEANTFTDGCRTPELQPLIWGEEEHISTFLNGHTKENSDCLGDSSPLRSDLDYIVAAECIYVEETIHPFLQTAARLADKHTQILFCGVPAAVVPKTGVTIQVRMMLSCLGDGISFQN